MSIDYPVLQKASLNLKKYDREVLTDAGRRSRTIIPGDDPGDQQPPEPRGLYPDPRMVGANTRPAQNKA
jgi:hypothetical protein